MGPRAGLGDLYERGSDCDVDLAVLLCSTCNIFVTIHVTENPTCPPPQTHAPLAAFQTQKRSSNCIIKPHNRLSKSGLTLYVVHVRLYGRDVM